MVPWYVWRKYFWLAQGLLACVLLVLARILQVQVLLARGRLARGRLARARPVRVLKTSHNCVAQQRRSSSPTEANSTDPNSILFPATGQLRVPFHLRIPFRCGPTKFTHANTLSITPAEAAETCRRRPQESGCNPNNTRATARTARNLFSNWSASGVTPALASSAARWPTGRRAGT